MVTSVDSAQNSFLSYTNANNVHLLLAAITDKINDWLITAGYALLATAYGARESLEFLKYGLLTLGTHAVNLIIYPLPITPFEAKESSRQALDHAVSSVKLIGCGIFTPLIALYRLSLAEQLQNLMGVRGSHSMLATPPTVPNAVPPVESGMNPLGEGQVPANLMNGTISAINAPIEIIQNAWTLLKPTIQKILKARLCEGQPLRKEFQDLVGLILISQDSNKWTYERVTAAVQIPYGITTLNQEIQKIFPEIHKQLLPHQTEINEIYAAAALYFKGKELTKNAIHTFLLELIPNVKKDEPLSQEACERLIIDFIWNEIEAKEIFSEQEKLNFYQLCSGMNETVLNFALKMFVNKTGGSKEV